MTLNRAWCLDAGERVVSSFFEAVLALVIAGGVSSLNASTVHVLLAAGLTAALTTAKTLLAQLRSGAGTSPASLVAKPTAKKRRPVRPANGYTLIDALVTIVVALICLLVILALLRHLH